MAEGTHAGVPRTRTLRTSQHVVDTFRSHLEELRLAPPTVRLYTGELARALRWAEAHGHDLATIEADELKRYVGTRPATSSTRRAMRSALRHYWAFVDRLRPPLHVVRVPRKARMVCKAVDDGEALRIAERALAEGGKRGAATVLALFNGLRREEVATVRRDGVDAEGWLTFVRKGNKAATVPLHPLARVVLDSLAPTGSPYYFPGRVDGHVHPATVWNWVLAVTGGRPPHVLRHTAIAKANDATGDLRAAQEFAGHERPETTAGYTRATKRRMLAVVQAVDYSDAA